MDILLDTRPKQGQIRSNLLILFKSLLLLPHNNNLFLLLWSNVKNYLPWLEELMLRIVPLPWLTVFLPIKLQHLNLHHWQVISSIPYFLLSLWIELLLVIIHGLWTQEQVITLFALSPFFNPILLFLTVLLSYLMVNQHMSLILALSSFPILLFLNMFLVFLLFHLIFYLSVSSLKACLFVLCFCTNFVSFRTFFVGGRLEWVRSKMVYICCKNPLLGLHLLCQIISPPTRTSSQPF